MGLFPRIPKPTAELFALHRNEWEADLEDVVLCKAGWDSGILEESQESQESRNLEDWVSESDSEGRD